MTTASRPMALALLAMAFAAPAFAENGPGVTATEIKIGNTMPYSGPASGYASQGRAEQAFYTMVNARGGINGRQINFLSYDDSYSPPKTVEQTRRLVEQDEIFATFGSLGTPTNTAIWKYMNQKKVPHLFISTGAEKWSDPKNYPYTVSLYPSYLMEARIAGKYIRQAKPDAKIGILFQNDDFGRDFVKGFKEGLGDVASKMIIKEVPYEVTDTTIDSQMVTLKTSGADTFFDVTTPKFGAQAIKKAAELQWKPLHYVVSVASSIKTVLEAAGLENSTGLVTALAFKTPSDPQWKDDQDIKNYLAFVKDSNAGMDPNDASATVGYFSAWVTVEVLKRCGNDLSRENLMKVVTSIRDLEAPLMLPGLSLSISPEDYSAFGQLQISRFDGKTWQSIGPVIDGKNIAQR
jgi:ABC-type branched-subunit amino acid transport system substrate-binding protein